MKKNSDFQLVSSRRAFHINYSGELFTKIFLLNLIKYPEHPRIIINQTNFWVALIFAG